jgi:hypothetical protein
MGGKLIARSRWCLLACRRGGCITDVANYPPSDWQSDCVRASAIRSRHLEYDSCSQRCRALWLGSQWYRPRRVCGRSGHTSRTTAATANRLATHTSSRRHGTAGRRRSAESAEVLDHSAYLRLGRNVLGAYRNCPRRALDGHTGRRRDPAPRAGFYLPDRPQATVALMDGGPCEGEPRTMERYKRCSTTVCRASKGTIYGE